MNKMTDNKKWLIRGIAAACSAINSGHDQPTIAKTGLLGFSKEELEEAEVSDFDMDGLSNVWGNEQ